MDLKRSRAVKLNDGHSMPVLGFGTLAPEEVSRSQSVGGLNANSTGKVVGSCVSRSWDTLGDVAGSVPASISPGPFALSETS